MIYSVGNDSILAGVVGMIFEVLREVLRNVFIWVFVPGCVGFYLLLRFIGLTPV